MRFVKNVPRGTLKVTRGHLTALPWFPFLTELSLSYISKSTFLELIKFPFCMSAINQQTNYTQQRTKRRRFYCSPAKPPLQSVTVTSGIPTGETQPLGGLKRIPGGVAEAAAAVSFAGDVATPLLLHASNAPLEWNVAGVVVSATAKLDLSCSIVKTICFR